VAVDAGIVSPRRGSRLLVRFAGVDPRWAGVAVNLVGDACRSLISSVIHVCALSSIGGHYAMLTCWNDGGGRGQTVIRAPEKRKVGDSTPPLTTHSEQR